MCLAGLVILRHVLPAASRLTLKASIARVGEARFDASSHSSARSGKATALFVSVFLKTTIFFCGPSRGPEGHERGRSSGNEVWQQ